jgi:hypothetical protein
LVVHFAPLSGDFIPQVIAALDAWIDAQGEDISRPEAIRRLVEMALGGSVTRKR